MRVWEIGPGIGAMTALALEAGLAVTAFEIDHGFSRLLARIFGANAAFKLVEGDFIDTWKAELESSGAPDRIFGNLPYNAANAMVASLIEGGLVPPRMIFTVQKEAGLRMTAVPGTKDYSAFSVLCTSACRSKLAFDLSSKSFWPAPQGDEHGRAHGAEARARRRRRPRGLLDLRARPLLLAAQDPAQQPPRRRPRARPRPRAGATAPRSRPPSTRPCPSSASGPTSAPRP